MKGSLSPRITLLTLALVILLSGCAGVEQFQRNLQESFETYHAPKNLDADPRATGLLLVDAVKKDLFNPMSLSGVAIANVEDLETATTVGTFRSGFLSDSGVVVIPNLKPGTYRLIKIRLWNLNGWDTVWMPSTEEFKIEIGANAPVYFGQIHVRHPMFTTDREIELHYDKAREVTSWRMVAEKFKESEWSEIVEAHIESLE